MTSHPPITLQDLQVLNEKAMQKKWDMQTIVLEENVALANALVNFWRSGGRELAEWAIRQGYNPELNAAVEPK